VLPEAFEDLTPKAAERLWFALNARVEIIISDYSGTYLEVYLKGEASQAVRFDSLGADLT
jgi:hypothetical protein